MRRGIAKRATADIYSNNTANQTRHDAIRFGVDRLFCVSDLTQADLMTGAASAFGRAETGERAVAGSLCAWRSGRVRIRMRSHA